MYLHCGSIQDFMFSKMSQSLTMNDLDVSVSDNISAPYTTYLNTTHVPPRVLLLQVFHGHGEHLLDRVVKNVHFVLSWIG